MSNENINTEKYQNLKTAYTELCNSYRTIDDFRSKLLAALPVISGTGISLLAKKIENDPNTCLFIMIGIFGFVVTLGLFVFEIYGIRRCTHLIVLGKFLEGELGIPGQFGNRPIGLQTIKPQDSKDSKDLKDSEDRCFPRLVNEPMASGIIYSAVLGLWAFLALHTLSVFIAGLAGAAIFWLVSTYAHLG
jgi:hypothetical protein